MALPIPVVSSDATLRHVPAGEVWVGIRTPGTDVPQRAEVIRRATAAAGAPQRAAERHDDRLLERVHDPAMLHYLATAWERWIDAGFPTAPGQDRVVPYVFPTAGLLGALPARVPAAAHARAGRFCYDTMTLIGPGTWEAARAAVDVALTAADLVVAGEAYAYALCRPPGHHASAVGFGGSCYLNNAAVAVEGLLEGGARRVAVIDLDAHHGNGTQAVFYHRADVFYGSCHVDPGEGWFPHFVGFADECGEGAGRGATLNLPLAPGTGDAVWLPAVARLREAAEEFAADAVVISLGVDSAGTDPESPLAVSADGFGEAGALLAGLGPAVVVQEGGYHLPSLGALVCAFLAGFTGG